MDRYQRYDRREVHDILEPQTTYTHQTGTWGLQGIIKIQNSNDYVFFVTQGNVDVDVDYEDVLYSNGILHWKTQNRHDQNSSVFRQLINHNHEVNNIYFMYRLSATAIDKSYVYIGNLKFLSYDNRTNNPVHLYWQVLDWKKEEVENVLGIELQRIGHNTISILGQNDEVVRDPTFINFEAMYERNKTIGTLGEDLIVAKEKAFLISQNRQDLAEMVKKTTDTIGNGAPYDIESRFPDGTIKHIEVKSTTGSLTNNFFISEKELEFARANINTYQFYRVYNLNIENSIFDIEILTAQELLGLELQSIQYIASIKTT